MRLQAAMKLAAVPKKWKRLPLRCRRRFYGMVVVPLCRVVCCGLAAYCCCLRRRPPAAATATAAATTDDTIKLLRLLLLLLLLVCVCVDECRVVCIGPSARSPACRLVGRSVHLSARPSFCVCVCESVCVLLE